MFALYLPALLLAGCLPTPDNYECGMPAIAPYGYGLTAPAYVAPIAPPVGVAVVAPTGLALGTNWGWAYHPKLGWDWHHPYNGWKHR